MANNQNFPPGEVLVSSIKTTEDLIRFCKAYPNSQDLWLPSPFINIDVSRRQRGFTEDDLLDESLMEMFQTFVSWVITEGTNNNLNLVLLNCWNFVRAPALEGWMHNIIQRNAKEVNLSFRSRDGDEVSLPNCLLCCDKLSLCLLGDRLTHFNNCQQHGGTKKVKLLKLNNVELSDSVLGNLLNMCELLEDLTLVDCFGQDRSISISHPGLKSLVIDNYVDSSNEEALAQKRALCENLVIDCPDLLLFDYRGHVADSFQVSANKLKTVTIYPQEIFESSEELGPSIYNLMLQVLNAESLEINHCFLKCLKGYYETPPKNAVPNFLKTLMLKTTIDIGTLNVLIEILKGCPNLESLDLTIEKVCLSDYVLDYLEKDGEHMTILTRYLKRTVFLGMDQEDAHKKVNVASLLLKHASGLESMVFSWDDENGNKESIKSEVDDITTASPSVDLCYMG